MDSDWASWRAGGGGDAKRMGVGGEQLAGVCVGWVGVARGGEHVLVCHPSPLQGAPAVRPLQFRCRLYVDLSPRVGRLRNHGADFASPRQKMLLRDRSEGRSTVKSRRAPNS